MCEDFAGFFYCPAYEDKAEALQPCHSRNKQYSSFTGSTLPAWVEARKGAAILEVGAPSLEQMVPEQEN